MTRTEALDAALAALGQHLGDDATLCQARVLLHVTASGREGADMGLLGRDLGLSDYACKRAARVLGPSRYRRGPDGLFKPGLRLLVVSRDAEDRRLRILHATDTGKAVVSTVLARLDPAEISLQRERA